MWVIIVTSVHLPTHPSTNSLFHYFYPVFFLPLSLSTAFMALSPRYFPVLFLALLLCRTPAKAATCSDCFTQSRAAHYPDSDEAGTETGACGFGSFGAKVNGGDVSAASELYRGGVGCGACYQTQNLRCKLVERSHGAVWALVSPPRGALSLRMLLSDGEDGDETWVVPPNSIPQDWKAGDVYDSGIQLN